MKPRMPKYRPIVKTILKLFQLKRKIEKKLRSMKSMRRDAKMMYRSVRSRLAAKKELMSAVQMKV